MYAENATPVVRYEPETGYLLLSSGKCRQVICRLAPEEGVIYLFWRWGKIEIPFLFKELCKLME